MKINREVERANDPIDHANDVCELLLEAAISRQQDTLAPETHPDFDGENCVACGDEMPKERLAMQRIRCRPCQEVLEHQKRQYAK